MASSLGEKIRRARKRNGFTQTELASRVKVSQATIWKWEVGLQNPDEEQKQELRRILGNFENNGSQQSDYGPSLLRGWLNRTRSKHKVSVPELAEKSGLTPATIYAIEAGRITTPRQSTIRQLERALGEQMEREAAREIAEDAQIEGIGEFVDFDPHIPDKELPSGPGVYVFYDLSERPIYVGQSSDIRRRIRDHRDKFWFKPPIVETGAYVELKEEPLRKQLEALLIRFLKSNALLNKQNVDRRE